MLQVAHVAIEDDRRAFCGESVFVNVGGDARHAGNTEVEHGHGVAELLDPRQDEAADARVDMERNAALFCDGADLDYRIDDALRVLRRGRANQHGVAVDATRHGLRVGPKVGPHVDVANLQPEVVRGLVERDMDGRWSDDLGVADPWLLRARAVACGLHRHQHGLGAAGRHRADARVGSVQHRGAHLNDLGFHPLQAAEGHRIQCVFREKKRGSLL